MILAGITVLDLTRVVSGPSCTRTLADLGADVIKIEPPEGDLLRRGVPKAGRVALGFAQQNAGKRHLSVNLQKPTGRDLVAELALKVDVLVERVEALLIDPLQLVEQKLWVRFVDDHGIGLFPDNLEYVLD